MLPPIDYSLWEQIAINNEKGRIKHPRPWSTTPGSAKQFAITGSSPACSLEFSTVICSVKTQITAKIPTELHNVTFGQLHEILHAYQKHQ